MSFLFLCTGAGDGFDVLQLPQLVFGDVRVGKKNINVFDLGKKYF